MCYKYQQKQVLSNFYKMNFMLKKDSMPFNML